MNFSSIILSVLFIVLFGPVSNAQEYVSKYRWRGVANYYASDKSQIVGIDLEASRIFSMRYVETFDEAKEKWKRKMLFKSKGFSVGQLGLEYNITQNNFGVRLGLFQWISFFSINPVQFVYNFGQAYRGLTYRPEIGVGFWIFQLNYGINLNFNKTLSQYGRHMIVCKVHLPY